MHALASGTAAGVLFTDEVRCPVHVTDLAAALLDSTRTQARLTTRLRGAREFLTPART